MCYSAGDPVFFLPVTQFSLISSASVSLEQAPWINTSGEVEAQSHKIGKQSNWLIEGSSSLRSFLNLFDASSGDPGSGVFSIHRHCFAANNYYCLPDMLPSFQSFKYIWMAIDHLTDGLSLAVMTKENRRM